MSERDKGDTQMLISERAAKCFVLLQDPELSETRRRRCLRWLQESPAHFIEILRIDGLDRLLRSSLRDRKANGRDGN